MWSAHDQDGTESGGTNGGAPEQVSPYRAGASVGSAWCLQRKDERGMAETQCQRQPELTHEKAEMKLSQDPQHLCDHKHCRQRGIKQPVATGTGKGDLYQWDNMIHCCRRHQAFQQTCKHNLDVQLRTVLDDTVHMHANRKRILNIHLR